MNYIDRFEKMGFGMFVHFGLYSIIGKGEWINSTEAYPNDVYAKYADKFKVKKNWAKNLVSSAKKAGCKYITLTTRHHDGFSLYDTKGLSKFDTLNTVCGRDLVKEFVDECNKQGIVPFFYHTLLDWKVPEYQQDFSAYIDYLISSVELLCTNYGKIGGFWFDGWWDKPDEDWQFDRLYGIIRKHQPEAMIINNTGIDMRGKVGHPEIDSVTFERGKPMYIDQTEKHIAGEMCQVFNDHWGYASNDINYKSVETIIGDLVDCRCYGCNFLLNVGPLGNGALRTIDKGFLEVIGKWIKVNKNFIYNVKPCDVKAENTQILFDGKYYYAVIKNVCMSGNQNVALGGSVENVKIFADVKNPVWLDDGHPVEMNGNEIITEAFDYGVSLAIRIVRFEI